METTCHPLSTDERFTFDCNPEVPCFNECCRDLIQFLTPYDILRIKTHLGLNSGEFLARHTQIHIGPQTGLPVVTLTPKPGHQRLCPFVSVRGCRIYENRPSSCRSYPLVRIFSRDPDTGIGDVRYFLLREPHCQGFSSGKTLTAEQWIHSQGLGEYNRTNDRFTEIIGLKNRLLPRPLNPEEVDSFKMALYDLDRFRDLVFSEKIAGPLDNPGVREALEDETALLRLGHRWIKNRLFGEFENGNCR